MSVFNGKIKRFNQQAIQDARDVFVGTSLHLFGKIVLRTPVGNPSLWANKAPKGYTGGSLRANWQVAINKRPTGEVSGVDKSGSRAINKAVTKTGRARLSDTIYITNNLPYAEEVERGSSTQAPQGMVGPLVKAWNRLVDREVRKRKK